MTNLNPSWPSNRQVLLNVGNRFVVFARPQALPQNLAFAPEQLRPPLSRVPDEKEIYEDRTISSVRVSDADIVRPRSDLPDYDFEMVDSQGNRTFVELKVRDRDPKSIDYQQMFEQLRHYAGSLADNLEIWNLNVDRLVLQVLTRGDQGIVVPIELAPVDVWDYGVEGDEPFHRSQVLDEVKEWINRLDSLYRTVKNWAQTLGLAVDRNRTVTMHEELMQHFAVPEKALPVLDISKADETIISFVPSGLWIIGAHGRVDVITRHGTRVLVNQTPLKHESEADWRLVDPRSRQRLPFDESAFASLVSAS